MVEIKEFLGRGFSSNVFLVMGEKNFLVDAGNGSIDKIVDRIGSDNIDIDRIILTHRHFDHTANAQELAKELGAQLFAQHKEADALSAGEDPTVLAQSFGKIMPPLEVNNLEDEYLDFKVIECPGHTDGGICLYQPEDKILFSGDTVFSAGGVGRTDLPTGNISELISSLERLNQLDVKDLYPGHGPSAIGNGNHHIKMALRNLKYL